MQLIISTVHLHAFTNQIRTFTCIHKYTQNIDIYIYKHRTFTHNYKQAITNKHNNCMQLQIKYYNCMQLQIK